LAQPARSRNKALEEANARLQELATSDPLTRLPNHRTLITLLDQTLERTQTMESPCSFLFLDFDHFKAINDQYGHLAGDTILCELATVIHSALREDDLLGRWGGEEFGVVLPDTDYEQALTIGERIRSTIAFVVRSQLFLNRDKLFFIGSVHFHRDTHALSSNEPKVA
jgi:diguanylate cyclase (GGDEF)-like protein